MKPEKIVGLIRTAATTLPHDVKKLLEKAARTEEGETAKSQLEAILDNIALSEKEKLPMCQDTGTLVFFVESPSPKQVLEAVHSAAGQATTGIPLRPNSVDPLTRKPLNANKPVVHLEYADKEKITVLLKGAGSENASALFMLEPSAGTAGIRKTAVDWVKKKAPSACPPVIVGVGIGGTAEQAVLESKKVLLKDLTAPLSPLEQELLNEINALGIGPMGLGGKTTALTVKISSLPCHTASLPVAVNVQCWALRKAGTEL